MNPDIEGILAELERLRTCSRSDFCAVACRETGNPPIRWKYALGNQNERFSRFKHKPGEGLAGKVFRIGRPILVNAALDAPAERGEYPIMLAENLRTAAAFPIMIDGRLEGVLLMGSRAAITYGHAEAEIAEQSAARLAPLLHIENPVRH